MTTMFTTEEVERIAREAAEHGARTALARAAEARKPPAPALDPFCDTTEAARRMGKSAKTIREYLRLAPSGNDPGAVAWKYGRDWRVEYEPFARWVRDGGPRAALAQLGRLQARAIQ